MVMIWQKKSYLVLLDSTKTSSNQICHLANKNIEMRLNVNKCMNHIWIFCTSFILETTSVNDD